MRVRGSSDAITGRPSRGFSRRSETRPAASEPRRAAIARPTLVRRLDEALTHRLTLVVGKAGFGKSTLLSGWSSGVRSCWYTLSPADTDLDALAGGILNAFRVRVPGLSVELDGAIGAWRGPEANLDERTRADALAALLCQSLDARLRRDLVLILDELHEINDAPGAIRLVEGLCRQAPRLLHIVTASRTDLPFAIERLRGAGEVVEITGSELAFTVAEVASLVTSLLDAASAPEIAEKLHQVTGGWPAAVRLAIEALRGTPPAERPVALERLRQPGGALYSYVATEVLGNEPEAVADLVRKVAPLEWFTPELAAVLGIENAAETIASLWRRGLFLELHRDWVDRYSLSTLVREYAGTHLYLSAAELHALRLRAAAWYEDHGLPEEALRTLSHPGHRQELTRLLRAKGKAMLARGAVDAVLGAAASLSDSSRKPWLDQLVGETQQIRGDWDSALASFRRAAGSRRALEPGLAWRMGMIHHLRGELDEAVSVYARGEHPASAPAEVALLLAWWASALWLRGEVDACREHAVRAFEKASAALEPRALAAAHTALALMAALDGDRAANDAHYVRALSYAEQAGDVLQRIRIHVNRGARHTEEGDYSEALSELETAIQLADLTGFRSWRALALTNRGDARLQIGLLDEAVVDLEAARALYQRLESRMVAYPLELLGDVHRERGDVALARAAYEEAIVHAAEAGDVQGLVPALAGLSRVTAATDPDQAYTVAERAVAHGPGMAYVQALLARGWAAQARKDRRSADRDAQLAANTAGARRDRAGLASALELQATAAEDQQTRVSLLTEARAIWHDLGNPLREARADLELARAAGARDLAVGAARRLREFGARAAAAQAEALIADLDRAVQAAVEIRTLGGFEVRRAGRTVPLAEWQSKKARDLLKMLIARRGHPVPRDTLMEALWPNDDAGALAGRLSVALATVRGVLDPEKQHGRDHFVVAGKDVIRLALENVAVDVEVFLAAAAAALAAGAPSEASTEQLARAEALYAGDFLEEDVYEDWSVGLREEARAVYLDVVRALAEAAMARADRATATKFFLRILERDPYDEQAYLGLVSTVATQGRHGEATRFYRSYLARMEEIGVEPAPFPGRTALSKP